MNTTIHKPKLVSRTYLTTTLFLCQLMFIGSSQAINFTLDNSASNSNVDLVLNQDTSYAIGTNKTLTVMTDEPFLCLGPTTPAPEIRLRNHSDDLFRVLGMVGITGASYNFSSAPVLNFSTNSTSQCVTKGYYQEVISPDIIFDNGFESPLNKEQNKASDVLKLTLFDYPTTLIDDHTFSYKYKLTNLSTNSLTVDLGEYFLHSNSTTTPHFSLNAADFSVVCQSATCSSSDPDNKLHITGITLAALSSETITVTRKAVVPVDTATKIDLLATALVTSELDKDLLNNSDTVEFAVSTNSAPTFTTTFADVTILEDHATNVINFTIDDLETNNAALTVSASAASAALPLSYSFGGSGSNRTLTITPNANSNTPTSPYTITVEINDGTSTTSQSFDLTITPVNDAPSFSVQTIADHVAQSAGNRLISNFFTVLSYGASDESTQTISTVNISIDSDPSGILSTVSGDLQLDASGTLLYRLTGVGGTATLNVTLQDDGGTANSGVDTSSVVQFTITVLNTLPTVVLDNASNSAISINEDTSSTAIALTLADAETALDCSDLSASSSDSAIIASAGVVFGGTGTACTATITPVTNQNTVDSGDVTVSIVVNDGSDDSLPLDIVVTIDPINDAPNFTLMPNISWPAATSGLKLQTGYAFNLIMGPTNDESSQAPKLPEGFLLVTSGDAIFSSAPTIDNSGSLAYVLNGTSGTASIQITLQDDGGTANGGVDTSAAQTFTIAIQ